eukprot:scaffold74948_cov49-Attheya_sp.AAC.7
MSRYGKSISKYACMAISLRELLRMWMEHGSTASATVNKDKRYVGVGTLPIALYYVRIDYGTCSFEIKDG